MCCGRACSTYGGEVDGRGDEVRNPLERPRRRWEDNIKIDLREAEIGGMD